MLFKTNSPADYFLYKMICHYIIKSIYNVFAILIFILSTTSVAFAIATNLADLPKQHDEAASVLNKSNDRTVFGEREKDEMAIANNPFALAFYKPTYILPFYYTGSPYEEIYIGNTPENQAIQSPELKAQFSFRIPLLHNILGGNSKLSVGYTQLMYWQVYAKSQYFRETNYEPEIFLTKKVSPNFWINVGAEHQSNGRGDSTERSWNRAYISTVFSINDFAISLRPWLLIFKGSSSDLHNNDIERYMGHGEMIFSYKWRKVAFSLTTRNNLESGFKRGGNELDCSFPISLKIKGYVQFFSGYGQSLIEYNHRTNSAGIGIALSDYI